MGRFKKGEMPPCGKQFTEANARECGRNGGKAAVIKKRKVKSMREWAKIIGQIETTTELEGTEVEGNVLGKVITALYQRAMTGDVAAAGRLADLMGENEKTINVKGDGWNVKVDSSEAKDKIAKLKDMDI